MRAGVAGTSIVAIGLALAGCDSEPPTSAATPEPISTSTEAGPTRMSPGSGVLLPENSLDQHVDEPLPTADAGADRPTAEPSPELDEPDDDSGPNLDPDAEADEICRQASNALRAPPTADARGLRALASSFQMAVSAGGNWPTTNIRLTTVRSEASSVAWALNDAARIAEDLKRARDFPELISAVTEHDLDTALQRADTAIGRLNTHC
ncbi:hypothetical protein [Isoptericola croceus]|uniref:hypothetical protein n=1 Tax=Isoptericola croceus TaxID=3031406 RepID=UPI0023F9729F|nr:hypothetical protein [Isoptericola croceus]